MRWERIVLSGRKRIVSGCGVVWRCDKLNIRLFFCTRSRRADTSVGLTWSVGMIIIVFILDVQGVGVRVCSGMVDMVMIILRQGGHGIVTRAGWVVGLDGRQRVR